MSDQVMNLPKTFIIICLLSLLLLPEFSFAETITYQYDNFGQLKAAQYGTGMDFVYVYDAIGNRETFTLIPADILAGDINGDSEIDLTDVIIGLKISSGETVAQPINKSSDVNSNNRIGMEEVIYIMQKIAE